MRTSGGLLSDRYVANIRPVRGVAVLSLVLLAALLVVGEASSSVKRVSQTWKVDAGDLASLAVQVSPRTRCTIEVLNFNTALGVPIFMNSRGFGPRMGGAIRWRWRVPVRAKAGIWDISVRCGDSGTLRTKMRVIRR